MNRDEANAGRGAVVMAVLFGLLAGFHLWRAFERGGESWLLAAGWGAAVLVWAALAAWRFRRARRSG